MEYGINCCMMEFFDSINEFASLSQAVENRFEWSINIGCYLPQKGKID